MASDFNDGGRPPEGASTIFILGLLGLLFCAVLGIFAWTQGNDYMAQCERAGVQPDGLAVAGRIMGMIATIFLIIGVVGFLFVLLMGGGLAALNN